MSILPPHLFVDVVKDGMAFKATSFSDCPLDAFIFKVGAYKVSAEICDAGSGIEFAAGK